MSLNKYYQFLLFRYYPAETLEQESNQYGRGTMSEEHIKDVKILEEKVWHWEGG